MNLNLAHHKKQVYMCERQGFLVHMHHIYATANLVN